MTRFFCTTLPDMHALCNMVVVGVINYVHYVCWTWLGMRYRIAGNFRGALFS